jgi:hypothetical protein
MGWVRKGNRSYYYRTIRVGDRFESVYHGCGPEAVAIAREQAEARAVREAARESRRRIIANLDRVRRLVGAVERIMELTGFYRHRGTWRRRGVRTMQLKDLDKIVRREAARRYFEAVPEADRAAEIERLRLDTAGEALRELVALATDDPHRAEATRRHVEATADGLAGPAASPLVRLLARLTATLATEFDVASGRLYRVAGTPGGLATPTGAAANSWAKSACRGAVQAGKCLALVQVAEKRESERSVGRAKYKVVG